jgi:hypothetical protein
MHLIQFQLGPESKFNSKPVGKDASEEKAVLKAIEELIIQWHVHQMVYQPEHPNDKGVLCKAPNLAVQALNMLSEPMGHHAVGILKMTCVPWINLTAQKSYVTSIANHMYYAIRNFCRRMAPMLGWTPIWALRVELLEIAKLLKVEFPFWDGIVDKPPGKDIVENPHWDTDSAMFTTHNVVTIKEFIRKQVQSALNALLVHNVTCITNSNGALVLLPSFRDCLTSLLKVGFHIYGFFLWILLNQLVQGLAEVGVLSSPVYNNAQWSQLVVAKPEEIEEQLKEWGFVLPRIATIAEREEYWCTRMVDEVHTNQHSKMHRVVGLLVHN